MGVKETKKDILKVTIKALENSATQVSLSKSMHGWTKFFVALLSVFFLLTMKKEILKIHKT